LARPRKDLWAPALVLVALATLPWSVQKHWTPRPDGARYVLAARSLVRGEGYRANGQPFTLRPPGFSLLLAPVVAARGVDFAALNLFVSLLGIATAVLFLVWLRARVPAPVAFAAALALWLDPEFQRGCNEVMSDVPGLGLLLLALILVRAAFARPSAALRLAAAAGIAAALYVRTANVLILPALMLEALTAPRAAGGPRLDAPRLRGAVVMLGAALLLVVPWLVWSAAQPAPDEAYGPRIQSYSSALLYGAPGESPERVRWTARLRANAAAYAALLGSGLDERAGSPARTAVAMVLLGAALWTALRRRESADWVLVLSVPMLLLYFANQPRLLLPVYALVMGAALETAWDLAHRRLSGGRAVAVPVAIAVLSIVLTFRPRFLPEDGPTRAEDLRQACAYVRDAVPPGAVVGGQVAPVVALLLDRPVVDVGREIAAGLPPTLAAMGRRGVDSVIADSAAAGVAEAERAGWDVRRFGFYAVVRRGAARP